MATLTSLKDLKPYKTSWKVQVKIIHTWKQYTTYTGETIEMILADETGTLIHATIKKPQVDRYEKYIKLGEWRIIENFQVNKSSGNYRSTKHVYKISLINISVITRCPEISTDMFLDLVSFGDVLDILGQVVNVGELKTMNVNNKNKTMLEFELRDTNDDRLKCTLWGSFADIVFNACENAGDSSIICLIRFAKVNTFRGEKQLTNSYDASQVFINLNIPVVTEFMQTLPSDGLALTLQESRPIEDKLLIKKELLQKFPRKTIVELLESTEVGKCKIMCTIFAIDSDWSWYYFECKKCRKTVYLIPKKEDDIVAKPKKSVFWCETCNGEITKVIPRYKLHVCVKDATGDAKCMLFDTNAEEIITLKASQILAGELNEIVDPNKIPEPLVELIGKTFLFLVNIEKDNLNKGNDTFKVSTVGAKTDLDKLDSIEASENQIDHNNIVSGDKETLMLTNSGEHSEATCCNLSTPSSKRKEQSDIDLPDQTSSTKKQCISTIKTKNLVSKFENDEEEEKKV